MAHIENLIAEIEDGGLRAALADEVKLLKNQIDFGLVFERHLPESVALSVDAGLSVGDRVVLRADRSRGELRVVALDGQVATVQADDEGQEEVSVDNLMVLKDFASPLYPTLTSLGAERRGEDKAPHLVINSENYHALNLLRWTSRGIADCIYIDPPYNTGAKDWKYNNAYVDGSDTWRHSKWLSFMEKRLLSARELLKPDGVLVVTIDEHEINHLGMLLEALFPNAVRQLITIVINPLGQARKQEFARVEEYAYFVFLGDAAPCATADDLLIERKSTKSEMNVRWERLIRGGTGARRQDSPRLFFPVFVDPEAKAIAEVGEPLAIDEDHATVPASKGLVAVWPINTNGQEGRWRCSPSYLRELVEKGYAKVGAYDAKNDRYSILYLGKAQIARIEKGEITITGRDDNGVVILEAPTEIDRRVVAKTVWNRRSHRAGEYGSALLKRFLPGREFPFPKSLYAVQDTLRLACGDRPDALIIDFFAGSGTTLHATCLLNSEDGGNRRCILVTNNEVGAERVAKLEAQGHFPGDTGFEEHGIFENVTRPRCGAVVRGETTAGEKVPGDYLNGRAYADGFEENIEFLRLDYLDGDRIELGAEIEKLLSVMWLRAGARGSFPSNLDLSKGFLVAEENGYAVLLDDGALDELIDAIADSNAIEHVFLVTDWPDAFAEMTHAIGPTRKTTMIPRDYLRHCRTSR